MNSRAYRIGQTGLGEVVSLPQSALSTHLHLLGATGSGKSSLIIKLLSQIVLARQSCVFLIDPLGGLADSMIEVLAHPRMCTDSVRQRLVYIEPANTDYVMPLNPLTFENEDELYFKTGRQSDCMLRSGSQVDLSVMLRLRRWLYNCFYSIASLGYPPAAAQFLVHSGTDQHNTLMNQLPPPLQLEWAEIMNASAREKNTLLDSTRNRLSPFFSCPLLNRMLSTTQNLFDAERFIRERKIVIVNLAPKGRMDSHVCNTIGSMMVNEVIHQTRNLPPQVVNPTMLVLDEFQNFVGDDLYDALPETRGRGLQLLLSHQSLSQLQQGTVDMRGIVWQARTRAIFANDAEDADLMAHEFATLNYDPMRIKDEILSFRQRKLGQKLVRLNNGSFGKSQQENSSFQSGRSESTSRTFNGSNYPSNVNYGDSSNSGWSQGDSQGSSYSEGWSETFVDELEDFHEVSSRSFLSFDEQVRLYAKKIRTLQTGRILLKVKDDERLHEAIVDYLKPSPTSWLREAKVKLIEENFANRDLFLPKAQVDSQWNSFVQKLGHGTTIPLAQKNSSNASEIQPGATIDVGCEDGFR